MSNTYTQEQVNKLVDGKLDWDTTLRMLSMPKDPDRFEKYLTVLQERVSWPDVIILPRGPQLYIVQDAASHRWVNKCACGYVMGDYDENWKLHASIFVRNTPELLNELQPRLMAPHHDWQEIREFFCPACGILHDVEAPVPWYPILNEFEPDIDAFYKEWVKLPLPERTN